ncbi:MAG: heme-binding domain-containing protein, partial [Opitutales bacterium]|nr:heme-binding domain-containing protein [Opitutales bacterium]
MKIKIAIAVLAALAAAYFIVGNSGKIPDGSPREKVLYAIENNSCLSCHDFEAKKPFYAKLPIAGSLVNRDILYATRSIDLADLAKRLKSGEEICEVDVSKMAYSAEYGTMPPLKFSLFHWKSRLNGAERAAILDWAKTEREKLSKNSGAANEFQNETVRPLNPAPKTDPQKAALGKELYNDTRLSKDNTISCATCHNLSLGGVDRLRYSKGVGGKLGGVNAPTVFNSTFNHRQFWDGRAANLEEQAGGPPTNPVEMASASWEEICKKLEADAEFKERFLKAYPEGISQKTVCDAIAEYERTLTTPNAPFDKYLKGDKTALKKEQIEGYELFKKAKCATCHAGHNLGGLTFEHMGLLKDYFADRGEITDADKGLYNFQKSEKNMGRFKTPTLRNVALT